MRLNLFSILLMSGIGVATCFAAEAPSEALLVLNKGDNTLAMVDPVAIKVVARAPSGPDPHEVVASKGLAFISNYGGNSTLSVVDLAAQKALPPVDLGALHSPHGLAVAEGKIYFTAEANKLIGRYDPAAQKIDWILGLGQERTHMIVVSQDAQNNGLIPGMWRVWRNQGPQCQRANHGQHDPEPYNRSSTTHSDNASSHRPGANGRWRNIETPSPGSLPWNGWTRKSFHS